MGKTKVGKGTKVMAVADRHGVPMAVHVDSASPHEVKLVEKTLEESFLDGAIGLLFGDKAYDSDALDERLKSQGTILVAPH